MTIEQIDLVAQAVQALTDALPEAYYTDPQLMDFLNLPDAALRILEGERERLLAGANVCKMPKGAVR